MRKNRKKFCERRRGVLINGGAPQQEDVFDPPQAVKTGISQVKDSFPVEVSIYKMNQQKGVGSLPTRKKPLVLLLIAVLIMLPMQQLEAAVRPSRDVYVYIDDTRLMFPDQQPFIDENNRTMVPLRSCLEAMGGTVSWNSQGQQVQLSRQTAAGTTIAVTLTIGSKDVIISPAIQKSMDSAPILKDGTTFVPLRFISEYLDCQVIWDETSRTVHLFTRGQDAAEQNRIIQDAAAAVKELPRVNSAENLQRLLDESNQNTYKSYSRLDADITLEMAPAANEMAEQSIAGNFSDTNTQVEGVDEADIVKTDGTYLYQVQDNAILIVKALPASDMAIMSRIDLQSQTPREIYIDTNRLIMISDDQRYYPLRYLEEDAAVNEKSFCPPLPQEDGTWVKIYDTTNKNSPRLIDDYRLQGNYLSSRKIGGKVYVMTTAYLHSPYQPEYQVNGAARTISYSAIRYFPDIIYNAYLHIGQITLASTGNSLDMQTFLGSGNNVYCSENALYICAQEYTPWLYRDGGASSGEQTIIHKFSLTDTVKYSAKGVIPGTLLNQFSMDEYNGYFRAATTLQRWSGTGSSNAVYILDAGLKQVSAVEGIAPGERIYSARFMGNRAYLVTFKQLDPFFVIDMNPQNPKILGKLKIPGFSNYLHPYGENKVIGLGNEVVDYKGWGLREAGIKLSMFDVTDVNNPVEIDKVVIGSTGSSSEATQNHKAFMLYQDYLSFPITVYGTDGGSPNDASFSYQGAYVYTVSGQGFQYKGRMTHLSADDYLKAGQYWYQDDKQIKRILYIGGTLYTLSDQYIKAHDASSMQELKTLPLK